MFQTVTPTALSTLACHGKKSTIHVKNVCKNVKINKFKWTNGLFGQNYRVAAFFTLYLHCPDGWTDPDCIKSSF